MRNLLDRIRATEPARFAELVRTILIGLVAVGWITIPDTTIDTTASVVGVLASWALTRFVRRSVTPVASAPIPAGPVVLPPTPPATGG